MIWVTDAKALPDYKLWVRLSDECEGEVDLLDFIRVEMDTVVWANGFDLAPNILGNACLLACLHDITLRASSGPIKAKPTSAR